MQLLAEIEILRQEMHELVMIYGIEDPKVLEVSQRLDALLNQYMKQIRAVP